MKKITNMNTGSAKSRFVFGVLGMFIFSLSLSAAEWYVDPVNGNDENALGSKYAGYWLAGGYEQILQIIGNTQIQIKNFLMIDYEVSQNKR